MKLTVRSEGTLYFKGLGIRFHSCSWRGESQIDFGKFSFTSGGSMDNGIPFFTITWR